MGKHVPKLKQDVTSFLQHRGDELPTVAETEAHIISLGYNVVAGDMFRDWLYEAFGKKSFATDPKTAASSLPPTRLSRG